VLKFLALLFPLASPVRCSTSISWKPVLNKLEYLRRQPLLLLALWPLALLAPHIPGIPRPAVDALPWRQELFVTLLLTVILGLVFSQKLKLSDSLPKNLLTPLFLGLTFVAWIWLSALWATDSYAAIHLAIQWTTYLLFFLLIVLAPARVVRHSLVAFAGVVLILGSASIVESWFGAPLTNQHYRVAVKPILRGSGTFGETMGVAAVLFASCTLLARRHRSVVLLGVIALLCWLATLQSLERAPFLATSFGLLVVLATALLARVSSLKIGLLACGLVVGFVVQLVPSHEMAHEDASTVGRIQNSVKGDESANMRFLLWGAGLEMFRAHPVTGVGANNYQSNFANARASFVQRYPNSSLVGLNDHLLPIYAHNEYVQMLAELGLLGLGLFAALAVALTINLVIALRSSRNKLRVIGPGAAMLVFAISSGASASSFRYLSGGLIFFFAAGLMTRNLCRSRLVVQPVENHSVSRLPGLALVGPTVLMLVSVVILGVQATGIVVEGMAEAGVSEAQTESYYRKSLAIYPFNLSAQFSYGMWLYGSRRPNEALPYLRNSLVHGLNSSVCFEYLAAAEDTAGKWLEAEQTLARAVQVYPRSVFLLVRHSVALEKIGRTQQAKVEFERAQAIDLPAARGWQRLIVDDLEAAHAAAQKDSQIDAPRNLAPEGAVFAILQENEMRNPKLAAEGWRKRMRSAEFNKSQ